MMKLFFTLLSLLLSSAYTVMQVYAATISHSEIERADIEGCRNQDNRRTFKMPNAEETISETSILRAIELTDTSTIVHYSFAFRPGYWCRIDHMEIVGNKTGKVYPLIKTDGYELGKKKYMPSSGRFDFRMIFPALDPEDTSIDIVETDGDGSKVATRKGVNLSGKPLGRYTTHIKGTYEGNSGYVGIMKSSGNPRSAKMTWVPVVDGRFEYAMESDELLVYDIFNGLNIFIGTWSSNRFFSEDATINIDFKIQKESDNDMRIIFHDISVDAPSGSLTSSLQKLDSLLDEHYKHAPAVLYRDSIQKEKKYYVPEYYVYQDSIRQHPELRDSLYAKIEEKYGEGSFRTPEGERAEADVVYYVKNDRVKYLCDEAIKLNDLAGLFFITHESYYNHDNATLIDAYLRGYQGKYIDSEYAMYMERIAGTNEIAPGTPFNDFSAKDTDGNSHTLSELIDGKPALLDLWASWCSPCRRLSKSMIPVYEEFAPKGFTIVGVAREFGSPDNAVDAIEKDGYKWINLLEVDDENGIWSLYRRQNGAGGTFLISPDGKIVKSDVTPEEVRDYLKTIYNVDN